MKCQCVGECGSHEGECEDPPLEHPLAIMFLKAVCSECAVELAKKLIELLTKA